MRFYLGFAGIPVEIFDDVQRENKRYAERAEFRLGRMANGFAGYTESNATFFLDWFYKAIKSDQANALGDTGFALIYVRKDEASTAMLERHFFPHTLLFPIDWQLDLSNGRESMLRSKNELVPLMLDAAATARSTLRRLHDEVTARASSTPLLLPLKNFQSDVVRPALRRLHTELGNGQDAATAIDKFQKDIKHAHPPQRIGTKKRDCYLDDNKVEFHPPGNARHAFSRAGTEHPPSCVLSGRRRLGAPYDHLFHYDCIKGSGNLKGNFASCHCSSAPMEGTPHLNIAPNDHVRGGK